MENKIIFVCPRCKKRIEMKGKDIVFKGELLRDIKKTIDGVEIQIYRKCDICINIKKE